MSSFHRMTRTNTVLCPCGIESENVAVTRYYHGHGDIVIGYEYWHDEDERCPKGNRPF